MSGEAAQRLGGVRRTWKRSVNAPCIGVGLMRKLARRFVVAPTPEAYTSKTCCRCLGECGPWTEVEEKMGKYHSGGGKYHRVP